MTISANFVPDFVKPDYAFFTNAKRFDESTAYPCPLILTSNLRAAADATVVNYDRLSGTDAQGGNSVLMLLRLLRLCNAAEVLLAGADGYRPGTAAYADTGLHTHTGRGADDGLELHASLHELIADDETDVAAADHQNALTWLHTVQVHQRLRRARAHDAGQCPAVERDHIFHRARCDDDRVALVVRRLAVGVDENLLVAVQAHDHRVEVDGDASSLRLFEQLLADVEAADFGVVLLRAKEFVDLFEQLSAGGGVLIENRDMYAVLCRLNGRRQSGRASAHNDQIISFHTAYSFAETPYCVCTFMPA